MYAEQGAELLGGGRTGESIAEGIRSGGTICKMGRSSMRRAEKREKGKGGGATVTGVDPVRFLSQEVLDL